MNPSRASERLYVTLIAENPQTLDGLEEYLRDAGVASHGTRNLRDRSMVAPATTTVVLFPDAFPAEDATAAVLDLRETRPEIFLVLVTSHPQRLGDAAKPKAHTVTPLILPKPALGWKILDAIRDRGAGAGDR